MRVKVTVTFCDAAPGINVTDEGLTDCTAMLDVGAVVTLRETEIVCGLLVALVDETVMVPL